MSFGGFTLLEVMIVLGLLVILMGIAYPPFQRYFVNGNLRSAARDLMGDFSNQQQRAMAGDTAAGGARIHRLVLDLAANGYTLQRCTTTDSLCPSWENIQVKSFNGYGNDVALDPAKNQTRVFDFQSRGTVTEGVIDLRNNRGSTATITAGISGRTFVEFSMQ
jgi:prepilin-type N-terminal cleavage/methylation domain-containing protein